MIRAAFATEPRTARPGQTGEQPLFCCPRCTRTCRSVFLLGPTACLVCHGLAYGSTRETEAERADRAAWKAYRRLDPDGSHRQRIGAPRIMDAPAPPRLKGMHQRTYRRLCRDWRATRERARMLNRAELLALAGRVTGDKSRLESAEEWREHARWLADRNS